MTGVPVFVSRSGVATAAQEDVVARWQGLLNQNGLVPVILSRAAYRADPWRQLIALLGGVSGLLVVGTEQISMRAATWRRGTPEQRDVAGRLPSPWAHIEAALALREGLPVLVVVEPDTVPIGVFDPQNWVGPLFGVSENAAGWTEVVSLWHRAVLTRSALQP